MTALKKILLVRENRKCDDCGQETIHWKLEYRLGGLSKFMTYSGAVLIPMIQKAGGKITPWRCENCKPLRPGVDLTYGWLSEKVVRRLQEVGEA